MNVLRVRNYFTFLSNSLFKIFAPFLDDFNISFSSTGCVTAVLRLYKVSPLLHVVMVRDLIVRFSFNRGSATCVE